LSRGVGGVRDQEDIAPLRNLQASWSRG
jgi:hypothetical protein